MQSSIKNSHNYGNDTEGETKTISNDIQWKSHCHDDEGSRMMKKKNKKLFLDGNIQLVS